MEKALECIYGNCSVLPLPDKGPFFDLHIKNLVQLLVLKLITL